MQFLPVRRTLEFGSVDSPGRTRSGPGTLGGTQQRGSRQAPSSCPPQRPTPPSSVEQILNLMDTKAPAGASLSFSLVPVCYDGSGVCMNKESKSTVHPLFFHFMGIRFLIPSRSHLTNPELCLCRRAQEHRYHAHTQTQNPIQTQSL